MTGNVRHLVVCVLMLSGVFCVSCAHMAKVFGLVPETPKVEVQDVTLALSGFDSVKIVASLRVENIDESRELDLQRLQYEILSNNQQVGLGELSEVIKLKPKEITVVKLPIAVKISQMLKLGMNMLEKPSLRQVQVKGQATIGAWAGNFVHNFDLKRDL